MLLHVPHLLRVQYARKRRVLAQPPGFLAVGTQEVANLLQRTFQNLTPLRVTPEQGGRLGVQACPAVEIVIGNAEQFRLPAQPRGHAAAQLKTDLVCKLVTHPDKLAKRAVKVNAAADAGINNGHKDDAFHRADKPVLRAEVGGQRDEMHGRKVYRVVTIWNLRKLYGRWCGRDS